jgi:hypothetical protein
MKNRTVRKRGGGGSCGLLQPVKGGGSCGLLQPTKGGSCGLMSTGQYGTSIFGDSTSQQAMPGAGNLIAMKAPENATLVGGKRRRKRKGGSTIVDLGVPVVLMGLNSAMTCRRRKNGKGRRSFRKRR